MADGLRTHRDSMAPGAPAATRALISELPAMPALDVPPPRPAAVELAAARKHHVVAGGPKGLRHKWLRVDSEGDTMVLTAGKHTLTAQLGVQARDLRLLDAAPASSPPALLAREKSIIVNLEFIKCIISTEYCLLMDSGESRVAVFVEELQRRLRGTETTNSTGLLGEASENLGENAVLLDNFFASGSEMGGSRAGSEAGDSPRGQHMRFPSGPSQGQLARRQSLVGRLQLSDIVEEMPFEMRALEAALDFVTAYMEHLLSGLEAAAHPALNAIIVKVTERRLDRLRTIKSRMVRLKTRVETIRELLEKLLDDDDDLHDMNLAAKQRQSERAALMHNLSEEDESPSTPLLEGHRQQEDSGPGPLRDQWHDSEVDDERDKDQVEQLLETYFMNLDNTWNRLCALAEHVDDTEDYIKFDIDTKRNTFIEYRLLIIILTFGVTMYSTVANLFGMNLGIGAKWRNSYPVFLQSTIVPLVCCAIITVAIILWARSKKLLLL